MARMVPSELPDWVRDEPMRAAEIRVYEALKRQFPGGFNIYYGRAWWDFQPNGRARVGEADFIVAGADWGILVIEVKGGKIERDGVPDIWTSTDRRGRVHKIKDPIKQAEKSMFVLKSRLNELPCFSDRPVKIGCAVILPDCSAFRGDMGIDMPLPLFAWQDDMDALRTTLTSVLDRQGARIKIGEQGAEALHGLLARSVRLDLRFGSVVGRAKRRIKELTEDQFWILDALGRHKRAAITGGAGTGKTVLALEKAKRLAGAWRATLLVCYSDGLGAHLKEQVARWRLPNLTACT